MWPSGRTTIFCVLVLVAFGKASASFFAMPPGGNTLWDELYTKCGNRVSFFCVQTKLMNYINDTLDSDLRITEGIYFVKSHTHPHHPQDNAFIDSTNSPVFGFGNSSSMATSRIQRAVKTLTSMTDNEIGNSTTDMDFDHDSEEQEKQFSSFVRTVEKLENHMETTERAEISTQQIREEEEGNEADGEDNFMIRSVHRVSDILYDKTTNYLSSHDLRLDLPQFMFGGSRMVVSPRGFDEDGGILLKLNFHPVETPRNHLGKYFHKMFKKKLITSFLGLLLIIKLIKIKIMYVLPLIMGVNAAKKLLLKTLLFLFPPLVHLFKLCTYYHAHANKLHFHHHKIKHHHHRIKVPVPVPVPVPSHKPNIPYDPYGPPHGDYDGAGLGADPHLPEHDHSVPYDSVPPYGAAAATAPDYYTRNDMTNQHGDELASWGLKDYHASTESPGVLSAQAQAYSPFAEKNYKLLHGKQQQQQQQPSISKPYASQSKRNKGSKTKLAVGTVKSTVLVPFDPFYSPILQKIDTLFQGLGFNDQGCRERLICSMYKDPLRFSPHSNLLSTELSRDPAELEKRPSQSNLAAVRFYRYVEAARDGQSQKDCLAFYPECSVKTE